MKRKGWQMKPRSNAKVKSLPLYPLSKKNQKERVAAAVAAQRILSLIVKDQAKNLISQKKHRSLPRRLKQTKLPTNNPLLVKTNLRLRHKYRPYRPARKKLAK